MLVDIDISDFRHDVLKVEKYNKGIYICNHGFDLHLYGRVNNYPLFDIKDEKLIEKLKKDKTENEIRLKHEESKPLKVFYKLENWANMSSCETKEMQSLNSYGIVDSPDQLLSLYDFETDPRKFVISLRQLDRLNEEHGGFRYRKNGSYYGIQKPESEYLFDDKHINTIFTFHIYEFI